jgi:hypothetical protein
MVEEGAVLEGQVTMTSSVPKSTNEEKEEIS